jgi:hypothetical protein
VQVPREAAEIDNIAENSSIDTKEFSIPVGQASSKYASTSADKFDLVDLVVNNPHQRNADFLIPTKVHEEVPFYVSPFLPSVQHDSPSHSSYRGATPQKDFVMIDLTKDGSPIKPKESTHHRQKVLSIPHDASSSAISPAGSPVGLQRPTDYASNMQPSSIQNRPRYSVTFASKENTAASSSVSVTKLPKHPYRIATSSSVANAKKDCKCSDF